jgi:Immunity protein 35
MMHMISDFTDINITELEAKHIAARHLKELGGRFGIELGLLESETVTIPKGWLFFYDSVDHIKTGDVSYRLAGNGPLMISHDGEIRVLPTHPPWQDFI